MTQHESATLLTKVVVKSTILVCGASGCGIPRNGAAVSMAGRKMELVFLLRTPGCQVDHTPE
ncbi:TPA: hypothetical protein ACJIKV_004680 [Citrobacter freundii]